MIACRIPGKSIASNYKNVDQFNFDVAQGPKNYHIEGYLTRSAELGKRPGLLVLNGGEGNVDRCVQMSQGIAAMGIQVACVSIPGYGNSSGPSRLWDSRQCWRRAKRSTCSQDAATSMRRGWRFGDLGMAQSPRDC